MLALDCFICGLARDCGDSLPGSLETVDSLASCFRESDQVIITNDSYDDTNTILAGWSAASASRSVLRVDGVAAAIRERTDRLALLRNFYLFEMRRRIDGGRNFDLMIVFDFDGVNQSIFQADSLGEIFATAPSDWGGLFPNQRQAYYDLWALRHPRWCPDDCWERVRKSIRLVPKGFRNEAWAAARARHVGKRQVRISPEQGAILVDSAFGGLGIYKVSSLGDAWYSGRDEAGRVVCEHVVFHSRLSRGGAKLYIIPALLNDAPAEHLAPGSGATARPWV